jgi:hypothetical protein
MRRQALQRASKAQAVRTFLCGALAAASAIVAFARPAGAATTINFESIPSGQAVGNGLALNVQYASLGVQFGVQPAHRIIVVESAPNGPVAHSGSFEAMGPSYSEEFSCIPFTIDFQSPQSMVQLFGGSDFDNSVGTLTAFDSLGTVVATDGPRALVNQHTSTLFTVTTSRNRIASVVFSTGPAGGTAGQVGISCDQSIDDLTFSGAAAPTAPPPPTITLTSPQPGNLDASAQALVAAGRVSGTQLFEIKVDLTSLNPIVGQQPTQEFLFPYSPQPTGNNMPFSFNLAALGKLPIGNYNLLATVVDSFGQQASASVTFSNFPPAVSGVTNGLGPFQFSVVADDCEMAFYQTGAVAFSPTQRPNAPTAETPGAAIPVPTTIAMKWVQVASRMPSYPFFAPHTTLGCPVGPAALFPVTYNIPQANTSWTYQVFERGRIYWPSTGSLTFVPQIFVNVSMTLGSNPVSTSITPGEIQGLGWPVADPDWSMDTTDPAWAFQRFDRLGIDATYQNTLEIRGRSPVLYVERVGGDLSELSSSQATPDNLHPTANVGGSTPTIWQQATCTLGANNTFPSFCDLSPLTLVADPSGGIGTPAYTGTTICNAPSKCDQTLDACQDSSCTDPQFAGIAGGNPEEWIDRLPGTTITPPPPPPGQKSGFQPVRYAPTPDPTTYEGIIRTLDVKGPDAGSHLANQDYPFDHQECNTSFVEGLEDVGSVALTVAVCANVTTWLVYAATLGSENACSDAAGMTKDTVGHNCRSDWNIHTRPIPGNKNWGFLSTGNYREMPDMSSDFEIEIEAQFAQAYYKNFIPAVGSLVMAHGRQIVDCAHCPYKAEIHPPDMLLVANSFEIFQQPPTFQPQRFTNAFVWGNGYLLQTNPSTLVAHAPPRPYPSAKLIVQQHESGYFTQNNLVTASTQLVPGGMQITLSGSAPNVVLGGDGEWIYPEDNPATYIDNWQLSWTQQQQ